MRHKVAWMGHPMSFEFLRLGLLVLLANHYTARGALIYKAFCLDAEQGHMNEAPNEARIPSSRFASFAG